MGTPHADHDGWGKLVSFPTSQETPEIALFEGYMKDSDIPTTDAWKIMTRFGPANLTGKIGKSYDIEPDNYVKLHPRSRIREEVFGGIIYRDGITLVVNKPAYGILTNLRKKSVRAGDIPDEFLKGLIGYNILEFE